MYLCPSCHTPLNRGQNIDGVHWTCDRCSHNFIGFSLLKQFVDNAFLTDLWVQAKAPGNPPGVDCPACTKPMRHLVEAETRRERDLQVCVDCGVLWLGLEEWTAMPSRTVALDDGQDLSKLPPKAAEALARTEVQLIAEKAGGPDIEATWWQLFLSDWGIPTLPTDEPWVRVPWATCSVALACILVSFYSFGHRGIWQDWGFMPSEWGRSLGSTTLSSFFLHGHWTHLLGNMYFFLLFGTHVENRVGPFQLLLVLFGASLAGDLATYVHDPSDDRVSIGASGGIAGIMLFFAFLFPKRPILWWEIPVPAVIFMLIWLAFEWIYGSIQVKGWDDGVGYYAHLGGGLFGWSYWFLARKRLGLAWENKKGVLDA